MIRPHVDKPSEVYGKGTFDCHMMISEVISFLAADINQSVLTRLVAKEMGERVPEGWLRSIYLPL